MSEPWHPFVAPCTLPPEKISLDNYDYISTTEVALTQHPRLAPQMVMLEVGEDDEEAVDEEVDNGGSSDTGIHSTPSTLHLR